MGLFSFSLAKAVANERAMTKRRNEMSCCLNFTSHVICVCALHVQRHFNRPACSLIHVVSRLQMDDPMGSSGLSNEDFSRLQVGICTDA